MPQAIDVTGLSPEAVRLVESLIGMLRIPPLPTTPNQRDPSWSMSLMRWAESHPKRAIEIDDSRESLNSGRGE